MVHFMTSHIFDPEFVRQKMLIYLHLYTLCHKSGNPLLPILIRQWLLYNLLAGQNRLYAVFFHFLNYYDANTCKEWEKGY